jgi:hypothetical protein
MVIEIESQGCFVVVDVETQGCFVVVNVESQVRTGVPFSM